MLTESIYNKENHQTTFVSLTREKRVDIFLNHFRNGMLPPSYLMLPPSVAKLVKLGPEKISRERMIYHICQITDCCSRSVNCLTYIRHAMWWPNPYVSSSEFTFCAIAICLFQYSRTPYASSSQSKYEVVLFVHFNLQNLTTVWP